MKYFIFESDWRNLAKDFWEGSGGKFFEAGARLAKDNDFPVKELEGGGVVKYALDGQWGMWVFKLMTISQGWVGYANPMEGPVPVKVFFVPEEKLCEHFK